LRKRFWMYPVSASDEVGSIAREIFNSDLVFNNTLKASLNRSDFERNALFHENVQVHPFIFAGKSTASIGIT